ncbi:MAG: peptidyl-prolyl cis-trans isomerase [Deltaproteobacteria bacterium]|nr:peptidyl-prolyl cis-trans isomerase [Deltaproteobacteria bacterium]
MANVTRTLSSLVILSWLAVACGGSTKPPTEGSGSAPDEGAPEPAADSPAGQCLAVATAAREPKPDEPMTVTVKHIVVKHGTEGAHQRSRGDACLRLLEARDKLGAGADFDELVADYSDESGAATRAGSLGAIRRDQVHPAFADAAFRLDVDQASHVVESKSGFHLIMRTE